MVCSWTVIKNPWQTKVCMEQIIQVCALPVGCVQPDNCWVVQCTGIVRWRLRTSNRIGTKEKKHMEDLQAVLLWSGLVQLLPHLSVWSPLWQDVGDELKRSTRVIFRMEMKTTSWRDPGLAFSLKKMLLLTENRTCTSETHL